MDDTKRADGLLQPSSRGRIVAVLTPAWPACDRAVGVLGELAAGHRCD